METIQDSTLKDKEIARLVQEVDRLLSINEKLKNELLYLRRALFGRSSERFVPEDPNQLKLAFEGEGALTQEILAELEAAKETITYERRKKKENPTKPVRQPLPEHLERKEEIIEPDSLPEDSICIGEEVTEVLEYTSGTLYIRRIIRRKYALPQERGIVIGELPSLPLPKSNAGASLLAHLLVSKYQDHLPFTAK